jgi:hypothetical protein
MKIDKDFAVKVEGRVFTANEISSVRFDIAWFIMNCISENGTKFNVEASLKDVEFLHTTQESKIEVEETRCWNLLDGDSVSKKINCHLEDIKEALSEAIESLKTERSCDIKLEIDGVPLAKMVKKYNGDSEPKTATEVNPIAREQMRRNEALSKSVDEFSKKRKKSMSEIENSMATAAEKISEVFRNNNTGW